MALSLQSFAAWTNQFAAQVQSAATALVDFSVGSVLLAVAEAQASVALWFQWLLLQVLALTRFATSNGTDADSWAGDFGFVRLGATAATGNVAFSRFTSSIQAVIAPGSTVRPGDGTQTFTVTTNVGNSAWNASLGGYVLAIGTTSATIPVQAVNIGSQGNVLAGAISQIASAISGIDTVTNAVAFTNGLDSEPDAAFRSRFVLWVNSRSLGTEEAVLAAVYGVQQGLSVTIQENVNTLGAFAAGNFVVTVDDGSGSPPSSLVTACAAAVEAVRGLTITYSVQAPTVTTVNVAATIATTAAVTHSTIAANVATAITAYINGLAVGTTLPWSRIAQIAYDTDPSITNVSGVTLNGATADIVPGPAGCIVLGTVVVS